MDNEITFNVRKRSTFKFILFLIVTFGYYPYIWLWKLVTDLNKLDFEQEKKINFWKLMTIPILLDIYDIYNAIVTWDNDGFNSWDKFYFKVIPIIYLIISIIILRKFEEYSQKKYNVTIKHSGICAFFFSMCYVNFAMNNFKSRVEKAIKKQNEKNNIV